MSSTPHPVEFVANLDLPPEYQVLICIRMKEYVLMQVEDGAKIS